AAARRQVIGVADRERGPLMAQALAALGTDHALVVHGRVGMDEISPVGETDVWEVRESQVKSWTLRPQEYGLAIPESDGLKGQEPAGNAARLEAIVSGAEDRAGSAAVLLNGGAAIYVAGLAPDFAAGVARAREVIASGAARKAL